MRADHVWLSPYFSIQSDFFFFIHMAMVPSISNSTLMNHNSVSLSCHHRWQVHQLICEKWAVQMGGATKRSFISAYFLLNACFLTAQSYKCMRLTTRVYGNTSVSKIGGGGGGGLYSPPPPQIVYILVFLQCANIFTVFTLHYVARLM